MKTIAHGDTRLVIRLDPGEELFPSLISFAAAQGIRAASFTAIGSADEAVLSWYNLAEKRYEDTEIREPLEVLGVIGNIGILDGKPTVHAHGFVGDRALRIRGGHIKKLVVAATCEVVLVRIEGTLERRFDDATGLNILA